MKATIERPEPIPQPEATVTVTMTESEARMIVHVLTDHKFDGRQVVWVDVADTLYDLPLAIRKALK